MEFYSSLMRQTAWPRCSNVGYLAFLLILAFAEKTGIEHQVQVPAIIPWLIKNKYYKAQVQIYAYTAQEVGTKVMDELRTKVDAVVCVLGENSHLDHMEPWLEFAKETETEIAVCVSEKSVEFPVTVNDKVFNSMEDFMDEYLCEFIDLSAQSDDETERVGIDRLIEVLETNRWDGLEMQQQCFDEEVNEEPPVKLDLQKLTDFFNKFLTFSEGDNEQENEEAIDFEQVLTELQHVKQKCQELPDDQRREMAARVAMSFGAAAGIPETEFEE